MHRFALIFVLCTAACAPVRKVVVVEEGTVRYFGGQRVTGTYVSPSAYAHYLDAQLASLAGRGDEAREELSQAIAADGSSAYLRTRYGEELLALGRDDEARDSFEAALRFDPAFAEAYVDLGRVALRLHDGAGAEQSFRKALDVDRTCEAGYLALASLYRERGDRERADAVYRTMAERVPESAGAHRELARAATGRGDLKTAVSELRKSVELSPGDIEARLELGRTLFAQGNATEAERELRLGYERSYHDPRIAELLVAVAVAAGNGGEADTLLDALDVSGGPRERRLALGWLLLSRHRAEDAVRVADDVLAGGESPSARLLRAAAFSALEKNDEAQAELLRVPPGTPEWGKAQLALGRLLASGGKFKEAADQLGKAIVATDGKPESDLLSGLLAEVHERAGDRVSARRVLDVAIKQHPASDPLAYAFASLLDRAGEADHAVDVVQTILTRSPDNAEALNFIGWSYTDRGVKLKEAQKLLERAHALRPSSGEIADSLGWLYYKLDRPDDAVRLLEAAERLTPGAADVSKHLGDAYVKNKDRPHAVAAYRRALGHNPDAKVRQAVEERLLHLDEGRASTR